MSTSTPGREPQEAVEARKRALKVNKACVPCRVRKVKCDGAVVGLPCSSCRNRQCAEDCTSLVRKARTRKGVHVSSTSSQTASNPATSNEHQSEDQSDPHPTADSIDSQSPGHTEPDLLYLHILNDAVEETPRSSQLHTASNTPQRPKGCLTPQNCLSAKLLHLDRIDREYLAKKGAFDLPPPHHLDVLVKTYFDYVHPFSPVISRADFVRRYQSGNCSLLLLRAMLATASLYTPVNVLTACGFASRSAAQESFFTKAKLLHDFAAEDDSLLMLQASLVLSMVILDHHTDRDFSYWFHNAISLATKLNVREIVFESTKTRPDLKLYRRIWWALYSLDNFHVFIDTRRYPLLSSTPDIESRIEDDWEDDSIDEHVSGDLSGFLSAVTPQQRASPIVHCELARILGECLSFVKSHPQQDPRQIMHPLDAWRRSLATKMQIGDDIGTNVYYLNVKAMSYRFECILCRLIRRNWQRSVHAECSEWAGQRFRSAVLELDTIAVRVLASGTLDEFPMPFVTTITALLALHIESALDTTETELVRSMSLVSISQTMLVLSKGRDIPALKRALPIFEEILAKNNLHLVLPNSLSLANCQVPGQPPSQDNDMVDAHAPPHTQVSAVSPRLEQWPNNPSWDTDVLGFDFLDEWQQFGQLGFTS